MSARPFAPQLQLPRASLYTLRADTARLAAVERRLVDVRRALSILRTAPWQFEQLLVARFDTIEENLQVRQLMGVGGAGADLENRYLDSPFWTAVKHAKGTLTLCLRTLQDNGHPDIANDTANIFGEDRIVGGDGQVLAVFPLLTLIFATFDIPVPRAGSALWNARTIRANHANHANPHVSVFDMIDLEARSPWYTANAGNKDRHNLKANLRRGIFRMRDLFDFPLLPYQEAALMPWADGRPRGQWPRVDENDTLLPTLVGAVKALQAEYALPGAWDPLADARTHCEAVLARLERERQQLRDSVQDQTVHAVSAPAPLTQLERDELLALALHPNVFLQ